MRDGGLFISADNLLACTAGQVVNDKGVTVDDINHFSSILRNKVNGVNLKIFDFTLGDLERNKNYHEVPWVGHYALKDGYYNLIQSKLFLAVEILADEMKVIENQVQEIKTKLSYNGLDGKAVDQSINEFIDYYNEKYGTKVQKREGTIGPRVISTY